MIKQTLRLAFVLLTVFGCANKKEYTDYYAPLRTDNIKDIRIEVLTDSLKIYIIWDKQEIIDFITNLNNSKVSGTFKGANWDKIVLNYDSDKMVFYTNGEVFGNSASGMFYELNTKYRKYWENN